MFEQRRAGEERMLCEAGAVKAHLSAHGSRDDSATGGQ